MVSAATNHVLDMTEESRKSTGALFYSLIVEKIVPYSVYITGWVALQNNINHDRMGEYQLAKNFHINLVTFAGIELLHISSKLSSSYILILTVYVWKDVEKLKYILVVLLSCKELAEYNWIFHIKYLFLSKNNCATWSVNKQIHVHGHLKCNFFLLL